MMCGRVGMSRQNFYAVRTQRQRREVDSEVVLSLTRRERSIQPRLGGRKALKLISSELSDAGVVIGRDRYFDVLRKNGMLVRRKPRKPVTTDSKHSLPVFQNLVSGMKPEKPNVVWVSDLTYIATEEGDMYAALITDAGSRKIVGGNIGDSLEAEKCTMPALEKALESLPEGVHPVHHSDRGSQYCCHKYVNRLTEVGMKISMTEIFHCYENALAERVNGILKQEYELDGTFRTKEQAKKAFEQAVFIYNNRRPHMGIGYQIPAEFHDHGEKEADLLRLRLSSPSALWAAPSGTGEPRRSRSRRRKTGRAKYLRQNHIAGNTGHIFTNVNLN